jgi:hypothetical protein
VPQNKHWQRVVTILGVCAGVTRRSKYLGVFDFVFGNTGRACAAGNQPKAPAGPATVYVVLMMVHVFTGQRHVGCAACSNGLMVQQFMQGLLTAAAQLVVQGVNNPSLAACVPELAHNHILTMPTHHPHPPLSYQVSLRAGSSMCPATRTCSST